MPSRHEPGSSWFTASHIVSAGVGIVGVTLDPSPSVVAALGPVGHFGVVIWSSLFIISGVLGLLARLKKWYWAETIAVDMTSAGLILWGAMVVIAGDQAALQAGLRFFACAFIIHGWAVYRRHRLSNLTDQAITAAVRDGLRR